MNFVFIEKKILLTIFQDYPRGAVDEFLSLAKEHENDYVIDKNDLDKLKEKYAPVSIASMIKNIIEAGESVIKESIEKRSPEEIENCLKQCAQCEWFVAHSVRCGKCGCFLKIKTVLKNWKCPLNKWPL